MMGALIQELTPLIGRDIVDLMNAALARQVDVRWASAADKPTIR
jgi:hypothetical protein